MEDWITIFKDFGWAGAMGMFGWFLVRLAPHLGKWFETVAQTTKAETVSKLNGTLVEAMRQAVGREVIWASITEYLGALPEPGRSHFKGHARHFWASFPEMTEIITRQDLIMKVLLSGDDEERAVRIADLRAFGMMTKRKDR